MATQLEFVSPAFISGIAFAAILMCAGLSIGLWLGRQGELQRSESAISRRAVKVVSGLSGWTETMAGDVAQYRETLELLARRLADFENRPDAATAQMLMSRVAEANESLQRRIEAAEQALQKQAGEISSYLQEARTDALTSLPNRRSFDDEFQRRIAQWRRKRTPFSLLLLDVDRFKQLNDNHGHPAGDAVLSEVGRLIREHLLDGEMAARFGGEEFAVLLPCNHEEGLAEACERFRSTIAGCEIPFENKTLQVTVSCGGAIAQTGELGPHLVKRADEALYEAKRNGRNCAYWHNGDELVPLTDEDASSRSATMALDLQPRPASLERESAASQEFRAVCSDLRRKLQEFTVAERNKA